MGTLRIFLALTVCINHFLSMPVFRLPYMFGPGARLAVEIFFAISGFYMALILGDKYRGPGAIRLFFTNRILRLYPTYLLLVLFFVVFCFAFYLQSGRPNFAGPYLRWFDLAPDWLRVWALAANLLIFGQDLLFAVSFLPGGEVCLNCPGAMPGFMGLVIPQAWSVEVEFLCYLLAPLMVTWRTRTLTALCLPLLAAKIWLYLQPGVDEFWPFRFPPSGLALFALGILAFRAYERHRQTGLFDSRPATALCLFFWAYLLAYPYLPGGDWKAFVAYPLTFAAVPVLFHKTRRNALDRELGELSYPIYLVHSTVFMLSIFFITSGRSSIVWSVVITLVASYAIHRFFQGPIERYRQARVAASTASDAPR